VSFSVRSGKSLAIIGPNGAGKTVLLKALIGAIPFAGCVKWAPGARVGYVPQKLDLERDIPLTGADFLRARARLAHAPTPEMALVSELVGLVADVLDEPIGTLSGGQFQRLLVAFALIGGPNILLLDEPTAGVDEAGQERLHDVVARLQKTRELTVVFVSHELSLVFEFANEVLCLARRKLYQGPPREILTPELLNELYDARLRFHVHDT
jgi:zinc transport system ATP-binding protein